jgi:tRNA1Val (adenine37-N6)-methyltransferase
MSVFHFKHFSIFQEQADLKVGTDSMLLGAFAEFENSKRILDIGTGTGVLSLMLAQKYPECKITALEINPNAFELAKSNFENNLLGKNCTVQIMALQDFQTHEKFDGIISNPPYFQDSLKNNSSGKSLARHTDSLSYEELISKSKSLLSENGTAWFILPFLSSNRFLEIIETNKLNIKRQIEIEGKPGQKVRVIFELGKQETKTIIESFVIRDEDNNYTDEYVELTKEFHNKSVR